MENLRREMRAVVGDVALADKQFAQLVKDAQELVGVGDLKSLVQGVNQLTAAGLGFERSRKLVEGLTNALVNLGKTQDDVHGVVIALTQISATDFIQGDELRQLQERLPFIRKLLTDAFGTSRTEDLKKLGVTSDQVLTAIQKYLDKQPPAVASLTTSWNKFTLQLSLLGTQVGTPFLSPLTAALQTLTGALKDIGEIISLISSPLNSLFEDYNAGLQKTTNLTVELNKETSIWSKLTKDASVLLIPQIGAVVFAYRKYKDAVNETTIYVGKLSKAEQDAFAARRVALGLLLNQATQGVISPTALVPTPPKIQALNSDALRDYGAALDSAFDAMSKALQIYPQLQKEIDALSTAQALLSRRASETASQLADAVDLPRLKANLDAALKADREYYENRATLLVRKAAFAENEVEAGDEAKRTRIREQLKIDLEELRQQTIRGQNDLIKSYNDKAQQIYEAIKDKERERIALLQQSLRARTELELAEIANSEDQQLSAYKRFETQRYDEKTDSIIKEEVYVRKSQAELAKIQLDALQDRFSAIRKGLSKELRLTYETLTGEAADITEIGKVFEHLRHRLESALEKGFDVDAEILKRYNALADIYQRFNVVEKEEREARRDLDEQLKKAAEAETPGESELEKRIRDLRELEKRVRDLRDLLQDPKELEVRGRTITVLETQEELLQEIVDLKLREIASPYTDSLEIELALRRDLIEVRDREKEAIIATNRAQIELAQKGVYSATVANAKVLEFLAAQKGVTEIIADAKISVISATYDLIDSGLDRITRKLGIVGGVLKNILSDLIRLALNKIFLRLFGFDAGTSFGTLGGIFGFPGGTPPFFPNAGRGTDTVAAPVNSLASILRTIFGGAHTPTRLPSGALGAGSSAAASAATLASVSAGGGIPFLGQFGSFLRGRSVLTDTGAAAYQAAVAKSLAPYGTFLGALGAAAPFLGLALGSQLGGQSPLGQILGSAGALLAGGLASAALAPGILTSVLGGTIAGVGGATTTGGLGGTVYGALTGLSGAFIVAPLAAAAIIGAILLRRNKRRRIEETQRTAILNDAKAQLQQILAQVKAGNLDGGSALTQAAQIRADYLTKVSQLKDKKTRNIAIAVVRELDAIIEQIKGAAARSDYAAQINRLLIPTFASGGIRTRFSGRTSIGGYASGDVFMAALAGDETVLTPANRAALGGDAAMRRAGVRGYVPYTYPRPFASAASGYQGELTSKANGLGSFGASQIIFVPVFVHSQEAANQIIKKSHYSAVVAKMIEENQVNKLHGYAGRVLRSFNV
jgi:tape measure domain-containing protein